MGIWHKIKNKLFKNRGSLVIEATFVYPIMFFILLFLLYMGNAYYIKARVQSVVSAEAITYAEKFSDPNYENFSESIPTSVSDEEVTKHLYRYIDVFNLTDYGVATQSEKEELIERIEASNFFDGMTPSVTNVKTHRVHNYAIYHTYEVEVEYDIKFPLRMLFREEPTILHMDVREETPIADTPEFIRNVDMGVDYFESTETGENFKEHLTNAYERIDKFINGDKRDPSEAVAGGGAGGGTNELTPGSRPEHPTVGYSVDGMVTSVDERIRYTPADPNENGHWTGERGQSKFVSDNPDVNAVLQKYGKDGVEYRDGMPDFSPFVEGECIIDNMSVTRKDNFKQADTALAKQWAAETGQNWTASDVEKYRKENKLTWHELNDGETMQLIPSIINHPYFKHVGGVGEKKRGQGQTENLDEGEDEG